jgi:hypothetical protein
VKDITLSLQSITIGHVLSGKWNCMASCKAKAKKKKGERMSKGMFWKGGPCVVCWSEGSGSCHSRSMSKVNGFSLFCRNRGNFYL